MNQCQKCAHQQSDGVFCAVCGGPLEYVPDQNQPSPSGTLSNNTQRSDVFQSPFDSYSPRTTSYRSRPKDSAKILLNLLHCLVLAFVLFPLPFNGHLFGNGYGQFGYGIRQQIGRFENLTKNVSTTAMKLIIESAVILQVVATIIIVCFTIASMIFLNKQHKRADFGLKLTKIFNLFIFCSLAFILLLDCLFLTFTFICAFTAGFYVLLLTFKPSFASDLFRRKGNENRNSAATLMFMLSLIIVFFFAPAYSVPPLTQFDAVTVGTCSFYELALSFSSEHAFLVIVSMILILLTFALFVYVLITYLMNKKTYFLPGILVLCAGIILSVLIGAFIKVEKESGISLPEISVKYVELVGYYYVLLVLLFTAVAVCFIQKALDLKTGKSVQTSKPADEQS